MRAWQEVWQVMERASAGSFFARSEQVRPTCAEGKDEDGERRGAWAWLQYEHKATCKKSNPHKG
jgi:hypothetical protein